MGKSGSKNIAVFLDRDGTLIAEKNYLKMIRDVKILPGVPDALSTLRQAGYKLILITDQSGVARGYLTEKKLGAIHKHLQKLLARSNAQLDAIYYCPHHPDDGCRCRKPGLALVKEAKKHFNIDLRKSFSVGDKIKDFEFGQRMGGKGIFVLTGHGAEESKKLTKKGAPKPDKTAKNMTDAARWILSQKK